MKISNVDHIYDNGEFVTLVTTTGTAIHLPMQGQHSISCLGREKDGAWDVFEVNVDFFSV